MADYLSLEEAAQKLGIPTEKLVDLRSQGEVRGFRDGASWKFPATEIDRLADELGDSSGADSGFGSGLLVSENELGSSISKSGSNIIGGDDSDVDLNSSDLGVGGESLQSTGADSDVNLVAGISDDSDVSLVPSSSGVDDSRKGASTPSVDGNSDDDDFAMDDDDGLQEIDSKILQLDQPAVLHDSDDEIDLSLAVNDGSTGPVIAKKSSVQIDESSGSLDLGSESPSGDVGDLSFTGVVPDDDSGDLVLGADDDSSIDAMASDVLSGESDASRSGASSLELMDELNGPLSSSGMASASGIHGSAGGDVLSELDLLSAESGGSGLISGDSENLLVSSGLGSSLGDDVLSGLDDALDDDDDLVIADDDDDLVIDSSGVDISVAGDSGINLMSPSDSGLSLESEPLDLAGSSISALDLGAELGEGSDASAPGSGSGSGSMVDFQADEEFQLSPSGIGLEADFESGSQVIEVEDSEAIGEAVEFEDADAPISEAFATDEAGGFDDGGGFGNEAVALDAEAVDEDDPIGLDTTAARRSSSMALSAAAGSYEVPFTLFQCLGLLSIIAVMSLGGMLMTDLIRNMWTYTEPSAPVSSLTDSLIALMGW